MQQRSNLLTVLLFCLAIILPVKAGPSGDAVIFSDADGREVRQIDLDVYFSAFGPGQSTQKMAMAPNIELATESIYVAKILAEEAANLDETKDVDLERLGRFLLNRELMKALLNRRVEESLAEMEWEPLAHEYYIAHADEFSKPEEVAASHILFRKGEQSWLNTVLGAEEVRQRILSGESFAAIADEISSDSGASPGGALGYFPRGRMVEPFENVAFGMSPGEMSDLVVTNYGVHIILVTDKRAPQQVPFADAKASIISKLRPRIASETRQRIIDQYKTEMLSDKNFIDRDLIALLREEANSEK